MTRNSQEARPLSNPATDATVAQRSASAQGEGAHKRRTDAEVRLNASMLGHRSWAVTEDRAARTAPGRAAFEQRFLDEAGGDPQKAESLRKAYFANLAKQSVAARRRNREARENGAA